MAEVRVRLPLGTLQENGVWESLRNPPGLGPGDRRFESGHTDCTACMFTGDA
jgi:hypothetical protein